MRIPIALLATLLLCLASPVQAGCFGRSGLFVQDATAIYQRQFVAVPQSRFFVQRGAYVPAFQQILLPATAAARVAPTVLRASGSSSLIVPLPWLSAIVALAETLTKLTKNVSLSSMSVSLLTTTVIGRLLTPGSKVSVVVEIAT